MSRRSRDRRSVRLKDYDYSSGGAYFVTICTHRRMSIFGSVKDGDVLLSWIGVIVEEEWLRAPDYRPEVSLDEYVIMPNHMHGILVLTGGQVGQDRVGAHRDAPLRRPERSLGLIVANFKGAVTRRVWRVSGSEEPVWQRNYYERVIRDEEELGRLRVYISENPLKWEEDEYY